MDNNELMHHGVLGMRWGVRKDRSSSGILKRKSKRSTEDKKEETLEEIINRAYEEERCLCSSLP